MSHTGTATKKEFVDEHEGLTCYKMASASFNSMLGVNQ
jgi:hypothetical protein